MSSSPSKVKARLGWLANQIGQGKTDAQIVLDCMVAFPGTSEKIARFELKKLYDRFAAINLENLPNIKAKYLEIGFKLLEDMRASMQYGPAASQFKHLAQIAGALTEKAQIEHTVITPTPSAGIVRDRITKLAADPKIRERAKKLGLDLDDVETEED